jgi:di- and tripeptidase
MRGVIHANLAISSVGSDKHSGVDGGIVGEPMGDMIRVLGELGGGGDIKIPGFCEFTGFLALF